MILDKSQVDKQGKDGGRLYPSARFLSNMRLEFNIPLAVFTDSAHATAHNKVMVIDGEKVITDSFNFTGSAEEKSAENPLLLTSPKVAWRYRENRNAHLKHSQEYARLSCTT